MKKYIFWLLVILQVGFIFYNSSLVATYSTKASFKALNILLRGFEHVGLTAFDIELFHHYVRKLAHFTEYASLGFLLALAIYYGSFTKHRFIEYLVVLFAIPCLDELLQTFVPGRTGLLSDVGIDMSGIIFGSFCGYILILIIKDIFKKK